MTNNLASNATAQLVGRAFHPSQELSPSQFLLAGVGGALGGSLSWGLTRGMVHTSGDFVNRVLSESLNGPSRAAWFGANITAGTLGGVVGDGLDQVYLLATGRQDGWNVGRSIFAGVQGAVALIPAMAAAPSVSDLPEFLSGKQAGKRRPLFPSRARSKGAGRSGVSDCCPPPLTPLANARCVRGSDRRARCVRGSENPAACAARAGARYARPGAELAKPSPGA